MKKKIIIAICLLLAALCGAVCIGIANTQKAYAATNNSETCETYGNTSYVTTSLGSSNVTGSYSGSPYEFTVYMNASYTNGEKIIYPNEVLNWNGVSIYVFSERINRHLSFELKRDGYTVEKRFPGGSYGRIQLYSGSLMDGNYSFTYVCENRSNNYNATTFTYTYNFVIDKTAPSYNLTAGGSYLPNDGFANSVITYTANDPRFNRIYYKSPTSGIFSTSYSSAYTVQATEANNGEWSFYAQDRVLNDSPVVSVILDTIKPIGEVNSNGKIISNGGYTNKPFSYIATDTNGVISNEYKPPTDDTWQPYTEGTELSGDNGWYAFRSTDKAKNVSDEFTICYDNVCPTGQLYAGARAVSSGTKTNAASISYSAADKTSGLANIYVKLPESTSYTAYKNDTDLTVEGEYSFYCEDKSFNQSAVQTIFLDRTKPNGTLYAGTNQIESGSYTNAVSIKFVATDSLSGISEIKVLKPNTANYVFYISGADLTAEGVYKFIATDNSLNVSDCYTITLDRTPPNGQIYANNLTVEKDTFSNVAYVSFIATDNLSGIGELFVQKPNSADYVNYISGSQLTEEGTYSFKALDKSNNCSEIYVIHLDRTSPTGNLLAAGSTIPSGAFTNRVVYFTATDSFSGLSGLFVTKPNEATPISYTSGTEFTMEGTYLFYALDKANNRSETYTVTVDVTIPSGQLFVDGIKFENGNYTNGGHIHFAASDLNLKSCFVKKTGDTDFVPYNNGSMLFESGKYLFYGIDESGNRSNYFTITIDRTIKPLTLENMNNNKTNENVTVVWQNGDLERYAPIVCVTVNGKEINNGQTVFTIDTGKYRVESLDAAGNVWITEFISTAVNVPTKTLQQEYFETKDSNGNAYAFGSYDNAFAFALARERGFVRSAVWTNTEWDGGIAMDSIDASNAKNGPYFIYKNSADSKTEVAYFTQERLIAVLADYAKASVTRYYYFQKTPAEIYLGNNLYEFSDTKTILANSVNFNDGVFYTVDGQPFSGHVYDIHGVHALVVSDEYGSVCGYTLIIVRSAPLIEYALGSGNKNTVTFDREYYLKNMVTISIADALDEMAMYCIYDDSGALITILYRDQNYTLNKSGKYIVQAVNHYGKSEDFVLYISLDAPKISYEADNAKKRLEVKITESLDKFARIKTLVLNRSLDNGITWDLLKNDDYGNEISLSRMNYFFRISGLYKAELTDDFRTGIDAIIATFDYKQKPPDGVLSGVADGGQTNTDVTFTWSDEAVVTLKKDGLVIAFSSEQKISDEGTYELILENFDGYKKNYTFVIDKTSPALELKGAENGKTTNQNVSVKTNENDLVLELYKDGVLVGEYAIGTELTEEASYKIIATDEAGNTTEVTFVIDKTVDFTAAIYDNILTDKMTFTANENLEILLTKDGEVIPYEFGKTLKSAGKYTVILTDKTGNTVTFHFTIVQPLVQTFSFNFAGISGLKSVYVNGAETPLNDGVLRITESGIYEIQTVVNGVTYALTIAVDSTPPTAVIDGATNGGATKGEVIISGISENAIVKAFFNGTEFEYRLGSALTEVGAYRFLITDKLGNVSEYTFEILYSFNGGAVGLISIGITLTIGLILTIVIIRKKIKFGKTNKGRAASKKGDLT